MTKKIDIDVMVNNGRTFYGRVVAEVQTCLRMYGQDGVHYVPEDEIQRVILEKFPTLKNQKYTWFDNDKKDGLQTM